jgi:hypothetical protein
VTGAELKQFRHDLGAAISRRLSTADMARICGLAPKNGADTWRKWEEGDGPSGPVAVLVELLSWAAASDIEAVTAEEVYLRHAMRIEILRRLNSLAPSA